VTSTESPSPTPSATLSPTPSPTATSIACGNGVRDTGEECDDGNLLAEDGCDGSCRSELIPGSGPHGSDCVHEWLTEPLPTRLLSGIPGGILVCHDDDPSCDFGATTGDGACTFHVALCVNIDEQRLRSRTGGPACVPTDVAWIVLQSPRGSDPRDTTDGLNRDALEAALTGAGAVLRRQCQSVGVEPSTPCTTNADCGHRRCRTRLMLFDPPSTMLGHCTDFADIVVPLRRTGSGFGSATRTLRLTATTSARIRDTDALKLTCRP